MLGYVLLTLLPVAAVVYLVWFYRRKHAERAAASSKRFAEMFGPATPARPAASGAASTSSAPSPAAAIPAALCLRKERLLTGQHAAFFRTLAAALPGHLIFPHVSLAAVVDLPPTVQGREREQRQRGLAQNTLDFVVCNEHTGAIAAIDLQDGASAESRFKSEYLKAAQLRYLRVNPAAIPAAEALRGLILADDKPSQATAGAASGP